MHQIKPYIQLMRLDKPIGIFLVLWPSWWAITLAHGVYPMPWWLLGVTFVGAVIMRSAGCVINDIWDRDFDAKVERTKSRPIAAGTLSRKQGLIFLFFLLLVGLYILLKLNTTAIILGFFFAIMIALYPLAKRFVAIPQIMLGLTFNGGIPICYVAAGGDFDLNLLLLYSAGFFWTIAYDTIYAHQDTKDDISIGIGSSALYFGKHSKVIIGTCYFIMILLLMAIGINHTFSPLYFMGITLAGCYFAWITYRLHVEISRDCHAKFRDNAITGGAIWLILLAAQAISN